MVPKMRVGTVFIPVTDLDRAREWYQRVFDLELLADYGDYIDFRFKETHPSQSKLTLHRVDERPRFEHPTFNLLTPDADAAHGALREQGVDVTAVRPLGTMRFFDFVDPEGHHISIISYPGTEAA